MENLFKFLPELDAEELMFIQSLTKDYSEEKLLTYANIYRTRRKDPQTILFTALLGFLVIAGIHRFIIGQVGMGILYVFTGGLCLIGTIVDLVNYKQLAFDYNRNIAVEVSSIVKGMS